MDDTTWGLVAAERSSLAHLLEPLTQAQWDTTSLCTEWRVRDVAAHLAMTAAGAPSPAVMLRALAANRGRLWSAGRDVAVAYGAPPDELVAGLRRDAAARSTPVFVVADNLLLDLVIHGQDIAVPLGVVRPIPTAAGELSLTRLWSMGWPFHARRRFAGLTVHAEDCNWSAGDGPDVSATTAQLLLLMSGRRTDVRDVHGAGSDAFRRRPLGPPTGSRRDRSCGS